MSLSSRVGIELAALLVGVHDFAPPGSDLKKSRSFNFTNAQASKVFADRRTLAASASEELDLAGSLVDALGATITFTKIRALLIEASSANANTVVVGGAAANAVATLFGDATDTLVVRPGGVALLVAPDTAGYAVTPATGDLLKVANGGAGTAVTYDITVLGASA